MEENVYNEWMTVKEIIHNKTRNTRPKTREIWWCSVGKNIGSEIYGKGALFSRPVLVISTHTDNTSIIIPLSSKIKNHTYSFPVTDTHGKTHTAHVYKLKNADNRRLIKKIGVLSELEFILVKETLVKIFS